MAKSVVTSDQLICVPAGEYELKFLRYETRFVISRKVVLWFEIETPRQFAGLELARYYNVKRHIGPQKENGEFEIGPKSSFVREYMNVFGNTYDFQEVDIDNYNGKIVIGNVKNVNTGITGVKVADCLQYSVISEILQLKKDLCSVESDDWGTDDDF